MYIYTYIHIYIYTYIHIHIQIYCIHPNILKSSMVSSAVLDTQPQSPRGASFALDKKQPTWGG